MSGSSSTRTGASSSTPGRPPTSGTSPSRSSTSPPPTSSPPCSRRSASSPATSTRSCSRTCTATTWTEPFTSGTQPVLVTADEIAYTRTAMARLFQRVLRQPVPAGVRFEPMHLDGGPFGAFAASKHLSEDGRVVIVATPGHTPGHVSVICIDDEGNHVLIAGDATDSVEQLHARRPDAVGPKPADHGGHDRPHPRSRRAPSHGLPSVSRPRVGGPPRCAHDARPWPAAVASARGGAELVEELAVAADAKREVAPSRQEVRAARRRGRRATRRGRTGPSGPARPARSRPVPRSHRGRSPSRG